MEKSTIAILGIPVDNLDMEEAVDRIFSMVESYAADRVPRQVATVNVDFIVNTLAWRFGRIRHPELIDILRRADIVTADGMPIVWISRLMGSSLKERVAGADLVPRLAEEAAKRRKSLYILGGREGIAAKAAEILLQRYPDLKIAGVDSPFIHVDSENLEWAEDEDLPIIARINRSNADILLIAFGNPKQEIWFDRNRKRLTVPVSIGIGGTYEFIVGSVSRAPKWIQKAVFEWVYRITQDPVRLWKRYLVGFFKFGLMVLPAIFYYHYRRILNMHLLQKSRSPAGLPEITTISAADFIKVIRFPDRLDSAFVEQSQEDIQMLSVRIVNMIFDFSRTSFIDSTGLGYLLKLWRQSNHKSEGVYMLGVNAAVRHFFKVNRLWDLFREIICESLSDVFRLIEKKSSLPAFHFVMEAERSLMTIRLFGRLDAAKISGLDLGLILKVIGDRDCILDLKDLAFVDSSGFVFFIKLQKHLVHNNRQLLLCNLNDNVKQMFRITKLNRLFRILPDISSATKELEKLV